MHKQAPKPEEYKRPGKTYKTRGMSRHIIGIDGEGHDLPDGSHIYTLLCAVDESGEVVGEAENPKGLSTQECLNMFLSLPKGRLKFVFMGSYDWTKIIEDLELDDIWYIMHPESRRQRYCQNCKKGANRQDAACQRCGSESFRAVQKLRRVQTDRKGNVVNCGFDWFNGSFTVSRQKQRCKVWDCFKFFQCSFVKAIQLWKIGTEEQWKRIADMKSKRGAFDVEDPLKIKQYCREECQLLAQMMRAVITACNDAEIKLTQYHGAGSIASSLLKTNKIKDFLGPRLETLPKDLQHAVMCAYFGGRFENSIVGTVAQTVYNRDIFSAYPYAIAQLPCLACGTWKRYRKDILKHAREATLALVHYRVKQQSPTERSKLAWAPFPCRLESGSICFPTGFEGWAWLPEFEAGLKGWGDLIEPLYVWTYSTNCEHKPFHWIPGAYRKRFLWGKDGKGIVMKLGLNACAGKTMQNAGDPPPFKSWIWGGMITATTRSQSLEAILAAKDPWNVLAIATDGVFATEDLNLPQAKDTGTGDLEKPLGNWGNETHEKGVFFVKPGMYFDDPPISDHDFKGKGEVCSKCNGHKANHRSIMRARGIGRVELIKNVQRLIGAFEKWDRHSELKIDVQSRRFYGARSSVLMYSTCHVCKVSWPGSPEQCPVCKQLAIGRAKHMTLPDRETPAYGRWFPRKIIIEFAHFPKRETISEGGLHGRMRIRDMGGIASLPYNPGQTTPEGEAAREATEEAMEEQNWADTDLEVA